MAKTISLVVKVGALVFILFGPTRLAINLQHMGNIWVIQTLPSVFLGVYTNWFHRRALMLGLLGGLFVSTWMLVGQDILSPSWLPVVPIPLEFLHVQSFSIYVAVPSLLVNLVLCVGLTPIFHALRVPSGRDYTVLTEFGARPVRRSF
jgi:SSS family solute:Na+ symporter